MDFLFSQIAFLGNFHPVMVHFPLALLPVALLLKLLKPLGYSYFDDAAELLLKLVLLTAVFAAAMGFINSKANGFSGEALTSHAQMAWITIALLAFAILLPTEKSKAATESGVVSTSVAMLIVASQFFWEKIAQPLFKVFCWLLKKFFVLLKWTLLLPVTLLLLLANRLYQKLLAEKLSPLLQNTKLKLISSWQWLCKQLKLLANKLFTLRNTKHAALALSLVLVMVTGYRGSNLVHGEGHLAHHAPDWLKPLLGAEQQEDLSAKLDQAFYLQQVKPVLQKNCAKCHNADKQKGNLQLDDFHSLAQSSVIDFQSPYNSKLIKRVLLNRDDPLAMPPKKHGKALQGGDIAQLVDWINGATLESQAAELKHELPDVYRAVDQKLQPLSQQQLLLSLEGLKLIRLSEESQLLAVNLQFVPSSQILQAWQLLRPLQPHIVHLDVSQRAITNEERQEIAALPNLIRLNLANTGLEHVDFLQNHENLRWLNLYGNTIAEAELKKIIRPELQIVP